MASTGDNAGRSTKKVSRRPDEPPDPDDLVVNDKGMSVDIPTAQSESWKDKFLESDYFSVNFQNDDDYLLVMSGGPWTIFGQYLSVRLWTPEFSTDQEFPKNMMVWIRLPALLEGMYTRSLLKFIGGAIGPVVKIDRNKTSKSRGQFSRIAVYIDLGKLLISKLQIDGRIQRAATGNLDKGVLNQGGETFDCSGKNSLAPDVEEGDQFGPWMLVERKPRRKPLTTATEPNSNSVVGIEGSRFNILSGNHGLIGEVAPDIFYGNTGNRGSTVPTLGTKLQSRDKAPFNPQIKGKAFKKGLAKKKKAKLFHQRMG
ncbi:hypothetical protein Goarm_023341 [Gossypium armourianum]|uniref:DUF4283 domain-containing protein n=1 Tax=Gossypium armourianum TaxID=34283 RepID=A0A7J9KIM3_9ROSI|nr:hypothetical protein [Gossypium armourianum]